MKETEISVEGIQGKESVAPADLPLIMEVATALDGLHEDSDDLPAEIFIDSFGNHYYKVGCLGYKQEIDDRDFERLKAIHPKRIASVSFDNMATGRQYPSLEGVLYVTVISERNYNQQNTVFTEPSQMSSLTRKRAAPDSSVPLSDPQEAPPAAGKRQKLIPATAGEGGVLSFLGRLLFGSD